MTVNDVVVVLPGIMGSTLTQHGATVWAPSGGSVLRAIATFGRALKQLQLPDGIGDNDPGDGVQAESLMPDLHLLPGLWTPIKGYSPLISRLIALGCRPVIADADAPPGNLLEVPYDWRLSNRTNGERLRSTLEPVLYRWRGQGGQYAEARMIFVCHSMGGLVARWYIEKCGGADLTRKLITLGTPYRGAAIALDQLVNGVHKGLGPFGLDLTAFARSLPSLYELLPSYACVQRQPGRDLDHLLAHDVSALNQQKVEDALTFHATLEDAETKRTDAATIRHAIVGGQQTTPTTVRLLDDHIELLRTYEGRDLYGDGTVPTVAGPKGVPLDSNTLAHVVDQHGNLQRNRAALDMIEEIITARPIIVRAADAPVTANLVVPDLVFSGGTLDVAVHLSEPRRAVTITVTDELGRSESRRPKSTRGSLTTAFEDLHPGAHTVDVTGVQPGVVGPVSATAVVWPSKGL